MGIESIKETEEPNSYVITGTGTLPVIETNTDAVKFQIYGFSSCVDNPFIKCTQLINVSFDNNLKSINNNIFAGTLVEYFTLPASVTVLTRQQSFDNTYIIRAIYVDQNNPSYADVDGIVYTKDLKTLYYWPPNRDGEIIIVSNGVEVIGSASFTFNKNLTYLRLPPSVKKIDTYFLYHCPNIKLVEIQNYEKNVILDKTGWFSGSPQEIKISFLPILPTRCPTVAVHPTYPYLSFAIQIFIFLL